MFNGINNRDMSLSCFIDMAKAFDTIKHEILVKELGYLGIGNILLKWITNYLSHRKQCTTANTITPSYLHILCGVPRGSILKPSFFIIHVNDISK